MTTTVIYDSEVTNYPLGLVGASPTVRYDAGAGEAAPWRVGTVTWGTKGQKWVFVGPAAADIVGAATPGNAVALAVNSSFVPAAGTGFFAYAPIKTGQSGWVAATDYA